MCLLALGLVVGCNDDVSYSDSESSETNVGVSMARFTIVGDYMYTVDGTSLHVVTLAVPDSPFEVRKVNVGFRIEAIYSMGDKLFIGSRSAMFIYDISSPEDPYEVGRASHITSCNPVVASGHYAYVSLNSASEAWCNTTNQNVLQVYDITDLRSPALKQTKPLYSPRGLAVDGDKGFVFVCDDGFVAAYKIEITTDEKGLEQIDLKRIYSTSTVVEVRSMNAYDCIVVNGTLIVTGEDGICQLGYGEQGFSFISKIEVY
jgi:hypothetical protein